MSSETNKTSNTPSATAQQMQDRQAGESPPGCRALPAAIEVCHRVFVVRGSVLWQKEAALTTHTAGNLILFHTYHLICLEQSSLSSQPCSMFFLYHSRSVLLFCLCVFAVRRAEKHTLIHTRTYTCVVEYVYANEAEVVCWCHSVTDRPCSRLIQGAGVSRSGWLATFLPFPSHPETILTLSPSAYPTSCWRFMTSWLPHSLPVPPSSLFSRLWVFCMEMCSPFSAGLRSYLAGLTSFIYCIGFSSFSFWTRGHRNLPAALLFVFHFPNSHFLSLIPTAALLLCIVLFPPPPLSFSSWFLWSLIFFDYICFNLCSSLLSAGFHSS